MKVERCDRDLDTRWSGGVQVFYLVRPDSLNGQATLTSYECGVTRLFFLLLFTFV
jgi:hypothetical protein